MNLLPPLPHARQSVFLRLRAFCFTLLRLQVLALLAATAIQAQAQTNFSLAAGWNLLGNSSSAQIDVAATLGDATKITTVWKWNKTASRWAFYAPLMTPSALTTYAQGKGYDVLTSIASKEGFWVNASTSVALTGPVATGVTLVESDLQSGWNLVGSADNKTPSQLNTGLNTSLSAAGKTITTVWAWDTTTSQWKFYAPSLEAQGGAVLINYITGKGYLPFNAALSVSDGFWMNVGVVTNGAITGVFDSATAWDNCNWGS